MDDTQKQDFVNQIRCLNRSYTWKVLLWAILLFGAILRLRQYFFNRSLWLDEACLAWNIVNKSFWELLGPLDYGQAAPIGFLLVEKLFVQLIGNTDYILRLFPLLCGIIALFLFYLLIRSHLSKEATLLAVFLFSISGNLIYYSSEIKQYSSDVAIALVLFIGAFHIAHRKLTLSRMVFFGFSGSLAISLSHPALFALGGIGITLAVTSFFQKDFQFLGRLLLVFALWIFFFAGLHFLSYGQISEQDHLLKYWQSSFMPFPPTSRSELMWLQKKLFEVFRNPVQIPFTEAAVVFFLVGCFSLLIKDKKAFFYLMSPLFLALMASSLRKYPFEGRLLLFTLPALLFCLTVGMETISLKSNWLRLILVLLIGYQPLVIAVHHLQSPRVCEEIKPLMKYIRENRQQGDIIRFPRKTKPAFEYYVAGYGFEKKEYETAHTSSRTWDDFLKNLTLLHGQGRVWIILTHLYPGDVKQPNSHMDKIGTLLIQRSVPGAILFLYNLTKERDKKLSVQAMPS